MRHRRLFDLRVRHAFFDGGACPDLRLAPRTWQPDGARALARHRLLALPRPDGLEVVVEVGADDTPTIDLTNLQLGFDVAITGPDFAHYTELAVWRNFPRPLYRGTSPAGGTLALASAATDHPNGVAATVEIAGISAAWLTAPPNFFLDLPARAAHWAFYLLTTRPNGLPPEIKDGEAARALAFERTLLAPDAALAADDPVGHRLLAQNPDRRCFRMISDRPIACRRAPVRQLALYLGDELLLRELSNPSISSHATLKVDPNEQPRPSLFRVIEY